jgi:hypothetical protein
MMKQGLIITIIAITVSAFSSRAEQHDVGFGIFLEDHDELVLSEKHITFYDRDTHEIELNAGGINKWNSYIVYDDSFDPPIPQLSGLYTKNFVVKVHGQEMYRGKFWSLASSASYTGIVIVDVLGIPDNMIRIHVGYPESLDAKKHDPRDRSEIVNFFKEHALLKENSGR